MGEQFELCGSEWFLIEPRGQQPAGHLIELRALPITRHIGLSKAQRSAVCNHRKDTRIPNLDIKWLAAVKLNAGLKKKRPNSVLRPG